MLSIDQAPQALLSFLASLRPKRFAEQNIGVGGIQFCRAREIRKGSRKIEDFVSPGVRRHKCFAEQNLGAGGIQFRRAREIRKGSRKIKDFVGMRRESGVPSVLRSKTLAQAEFSSAEQEKSERDPAKSKILWGCAGSPASQAFCGAKPWRRRNSFLPSKRNQKGFPQNRRFCGQNEAVGSKRATAAGAIKLFGRPFSRKVRRESGVTSVLRSKTLAQAEFTSAEQEKSERVPAKLKILWAKRGSW